MLSDRWRQETARKSHTYTTPSSPASLLRNTQANAFRQAKTPRRTLPIFGSLGISSLCDSVRVGVYVCLCLCVMVSVRGHVCVCVCVLSVCA
jgi:hypothetical protein